MKDITKPEQQFEKFARFQALQAGHYWRAVVDVPEQAIDKDEVLLIQSIRWVDNAAHTIIMRAHPSKFDTYQRREITREDGSTHSTQIKCETHRFLLRDFLDKFEFEPDHEKIRTSEVQAIHGRIGQLQQELVEGQTDPQVLAQITYDGLKKNQEAELRKAGATEQEIAAASVQTDQQATQQMMSVAGGTVADALGTGITAEGIKELRATVSRQSEIAKIKASWITSKTGEIAATIQALTPFYKEQAAAALANTEDIRKQVDQLMLGIESLDLYVGKDVVVRSICKGRSADADEPLTFVQRKLMVDEELAVWADVEEWFDFNDHDLFYDALSKHESLLDQLFPTERCIVVMATTRRDLDYGHAIANAELNGKNRTVFLMVRDGENIHQVYSPVESHLHAARLFPSKDDQDRVFAGVDGTSIKFDDVVYTDRLADHERYALHYKRFLLLVCGLDHRMKLFGDFYQGPPSLNFVSLAFQEERCRFLHDDDGAGLLPGEVRQSLDSWLREKNEYLRSGSRVLCNWNSVMNPDTAPGACKPDRRGDDFDFRYRAKNTMDIVVANKHGDSTCVDIDVSGYSYAKDGNREFKCRVNLTALKDSRWGRSQLAYLCLDAVTPEEIHWYIHNRESRKNHIHYIRFFKVALRHLLIEREQERGTRQKMAQALLDGKIASGNEADGIIQQAVIAWRAANRGKQLPSFVGSKPPAHWKSLLDQMYLLAGEGKKQASAVETYIGSIGLTPLRLVLSGNAKLVVYAAPLPEECDDRLGAHAWVHCIQLEHGKSGLEEASRKWTLLPKAAASETTLHEWSDVSSWTDKVSTFASFTEKQEIFDFASQGIGKLKAFMKPWTISEFSRYFAEWQVAREDAMAKSKHVENPDIAFPVGVVRFRGEMRYLCISADPVGLLYKMAPDELARDRLRMEFVKVYANKEMAVSRFMKATYESRIWSLVEITLNLRSSAYKQFVHSKFDLWNVTADGYKQSDPLINNWIERYRSEAKPSNGGVWLADDLSDDSGSFVLDRILGNALPEDYKPTTVRSVTLSVRTDSWPAGDSETTKWFDVYDGAEAPDRMKIPDGYTSMSSHEHTALTLEDARRYIAEKASADPSAQCVRSSELDPVPDLPQGVMERWCVVPNKAALT